jgi:hypothetical protein
MRLRTVAIATTLAFVELPLCVQKFRWSNMDSQTWTNVIAISNLVIATTAVIVALAAPRIAAHLNADSDLKRQKRAEKLWILGQLMQTRPSSESPEAVRALNLIEVVYHDQPNIRGIWRDYHAMISNSAFFGNNVNIGWQLIKTKKV